MRWFGAAAEPGAVIRTDGPAVRPYLCGPAKTTAQNAKDHSEGAVAP